MRFGVLCCTMVVWYASPAAAQAFQAARFFDPPPIQTTPEDANLESVLSAVAESLPATLDALNSIRAKQDGSVSGMLGTMEAFLGIGKKVMTSLASQSGQSPNSKNFENLDQVEMVLRAFEGFMKELMNAGVVQNTATIVPKVDTPSISLKDLAPLLKAFLGTDPVSPDPSVGAGSPVSPVNAAPQTKAPTQNTPAAEVTVAEVTVPADHHAVFINHPHYNDPLWKLTPEQRLIYQE